MSQTSVDVAGGRYSRQSSLVPMDRLADLGQVTVIGVGAVGKQVAIQLTCLGVHDLTLIDFDQVEEGNLSPQAFRECDLGCQKVHAVKSVCEQLDSHCKINAIDGKFTKNMEVGQVVFCCVDKVETRRFIWNTVKDRCRFFGDSRVGVEMIRVITVCDPAGREHYPKTLFNPGEAFVGPCTARMTIYMANLAAGFLVAQFTKWLRGMPVDPDLGIDVLSMDISPIGEAP